jgi:hypothetical protein
MGKTTSAHALHPKSHLGDLGVKHRQTIITPFSPAEGQVNRKCKSLVKLASFTRIVAEKPLFLSFHNLEKVSFCLVIQQLTCHAIQKRN